MKYRVKAVKNGTDTYTDELHITDMIPSIVNGYIPQYLTPYTGSAMQGVLAVEDTLEKRNDNIDIYSAKILGNGYYGNSTTGKYTLTGISGHLGSLAFTYKDAAQNYDDINNLTSGGLGRYPNKPYFVDPENNAVYILYDDSWNSKDLGLFKYKVKMPSFGLKGWDFTAINLDDSNCATLEKTSTIPKELFNVNYYYSGYSDPNYPDCNIYSQSIIHYGTFNGHSITQNKDYLILLNYFKYYPIDLSTMTWEGEKIIVSEDMTVPIHSFFDIVLVDKRTFSYTSYHLTDIDDETTSTVHVGEYTATYLFGEYNAGDVLQYRAEAADDNYVYLVGNSKDENENDVYDLYRLSLSNLQDGVKVEYVSGYDKSICHTINRKNAVYQSSWNSFNNEVFKLGISKGLNCFTNIFKSGISAIANFDIDLTESDTLEISLEVIDE